MKPIDTDSFFADDQHNSLYLLCALIAGFVEVAALVLGEGYILFWITHVVISISLSLLVVYAAKKEWDLRFVLLLWLGIVIFGPFGSIAYFSCMLFYAIFKRMSTPFEKWYTALFPELRMTQAGKIYERIISGWDDFKTQREVISFQDLMRFGSLEQKQKALEMIVLNFNPLLAPVLKLALNDQSNQIRVQAASIVAKIDREFEEKKIALMRELQAHPDQLSHLLALADHLDTYAFSGILDVIREKEYRELAITYYKQYIEQRPDDHQAWMALGRLLNRLNAFDQVLIWFEERLKKEVYIPPSGLIWYWEALYMLRSFNKLTDSAREAYQRLLKTHPQKNVLECVELWANKN